MMSFRSGASRSKTVLTLAFIAAFGLASCADYKATHHAVEVDQSTADRALQEISPKRPLARSLEIDNRPYYGSAAVPITNGSPLPPQFEQPNSIVMTFARPVTMPELARMIQAVTGLRAIAGKVATTDSGGEQRPITFIPTDGEQVAGGRVVWQGRLSDLLNQASDEFGADWRFSGSTIEFASMVTRTFMLNALAAELEMSGAVESTGGGDSGGNLPTMNVEATSSLKVWEEIKEAVGTIMGDNGKAAFSPSTGTITVTGTPTAVRQVESYLNQQNSLRLRRVAVAIKVLSIVGSNSTDLSADVTGIIKKAFDQASLRSVGEATGGIAIGVLKAPLNAADTAAIDSDRLITQLKADRRVERASVVHSGALVTLSDQPAPLQVGRQISYLERTSSTSGDTGGSVSLEPGTINTGLMMTVLPRIVEGNRILMRLSLAITDAQQPFPSFGSGDTQIQLPEVETTGFLQNAVLTSGETLVLAGFEKNLNSAVDDGTPYLPLFGGSRNSNRGREVTVLLLTSEILPEEPMTVIGQ